MNTNVKKKENLNKVFVEFSNIYRVIPHNQVKIIPGMQGWFNYKSVNFQHRRLKEFKSRKTHLRSST